MGITAAVSRRLTAVAGLGVATAVACVPAPAALAQGQADQQVPLDRPGVQVALARGVPQLPQQLSALSWTVSDATTGDVLAAQNAHRRLAPASTLKTLFAVTVLPKFPQDRVRKVTAADLAGIGDGSSLVGVQAGRRYRVADLWRGVFLRSGNDAVHVLAHMNGGWLTTAREMQAKARELGARDTQVKSPDGYDQPGQVSSAFDLSIFARAGLNNPDFARYCGTAAADFPGKDEHGTTRIQNTNRLLTGADGLNRYQGVIGVKNGYTTHAGNTVVVAARRGGRTLLVTVMNPRSGERNGVYKEAERLLDWGFAAAGHARPVGALGSASGPHRATGGLAHHRPAQGGTATGSQAADSTSPAGTALWIGGSALVLVGAAGIAWRRLHIRPRSLDHRWAPDPARPVDPDRSGPDEDTGTLSGGGRRIG
ncbi:D-alanyl-D-alanine carboxypeptidase family protein [Streptomyces sp. NPDC059740]|uniref:D-alanyl-D-alanine carboxypeptidase family protein n=1 Tax=Streptomyces sp. NPDC059740 TaxID=3346926 RepID=UPI00365AA294